MKTKTRIRADESSMKQTSFCAVALHSLSYLRLYKKRVKNVITTI